MIANAQPRERIAVYHLHQAPAAILRLVIRCDDDPELCARIGATTVAGLHAAWDGIKHQVITEAIRAGFDQAHVIDQATGERLATIHIH
jgi:predicted NAD-dependent protein-ADP-ribosyltransferase YbiA (DUF1768 family)